MLKNYFKIALRNLIKNKLHFGINLIGLTLGLGVSILIFFFVQFELTFDDFHEESELIFRLERHEMGEDGIGSSFSTPVITAPTFKGEFAQVTHATQLIGASAQAYLDESTTQNQEYLLVNTDFLEIFSFPLLKGDRSKVLEDKYSVVVTETVAKKYFGEADPLGKSIRLKMGENFEEYQVTGLLADIPANSSLKFEMLINNLNLDYSISKQSQNSWFNVYGDTYLKITDPQAKGTIEAGVEGMMKKALGTNYKEGDYYFTLQSLSDIHLSDASNSGMAETTRPSLLLILTGIAFLILLIACINFTTMAIGRATTRAKEVGVRKTMGAEFIQLVFQFLTEAFLITLSALALGLLLAEALLPIFNDLFEKQLQLVYGPIQILILLGLVCIITFLAGAYPALFMSGLRPIQVLK
uniref:ABC transporter permease n=1 Tax=Algoriphagus sp. TaxID=1872435 RepID=UPI0025871244